MTDGGSVESLLDILELIDRIQRQTSGLGRESFLLDADVQDATAYRILAIGEASRDLSDDLKARHPDVPWRDILAMRNLLAHEYFVRESDIIWETVRLGLPELGRVCRSELKRLGWTGAPSS
ncbi:MAG: HepT-like ribonuclease domain-containing protein [Caulobacteraceae bacterium]